MALQAGEQIGGYRIIEQLGQGGMATIYKAYHARLDRHVAIKVMHQAFLEDPTFIARFEREAQIIARLEHAHIVPVYDFAEHGGQPYLVMKYIEGQTLKALLARGALTLDAITRMLTAIASALDYAHAQGVLHRDIKPSNIILDVNGVPYLSDFGLARIVQAGESTLSQDMLLGTPQYISPEQAMGRRDLDQHTDLYALGVVLYELVVGRVPFNADTPYAIIHDHIYRPLPLPNAVNPDIPAAVSDMLARALAKDPLTRYHSASELLGAFQAAVAEGGLAQLAPDRPLVADVSLAQMRGSAYTPAPPPPVPTADRPADKPKRPPFVPPPPLPPPGRRRAERERVEASVDLGDLGERIKAEVSQWEDSNWNPDNWEDNADVPRNDDDSLRKRVEKQIEKRTELYTHAAIFVVINLTLIVGYLGAGAIFNGDGEIEWLGFPFPLVVLLGWGSGLVAHAISVWYDTGERAARKERAVRGAMRASYGGGWAQTVSRDEYNKVRRRILRPCKQREEFWQHLPIYLLINLMLTAIYLFASDIFTSTGVDLEALDFPWPLLVWLGWGAGVIGHAVETFGGAKSRREADIQREMERERQRLMDDEAFEKAKRSGDFDALEADSRPVRLNPDGEITDSVAQVWEMDDDARRQRGQR